MRRREPVSSKGEGWRQWRWWVLAAGGCVLALVAFALAGLSLMVAWLDTPPGERWLVSEINSRVPGVEIGQLRGNVFRAFEIEDLSLSDDQGPWLTIAEAELSWNPLALIQGLVRVEALEVGQAVLARLPEESEEDDRPFELELPQLPELPIDALVDRLEIESLALEEPALGVAARLYAEGHAALIKGERIDVDLLVRRLDEADDRLRARMDYDQASELLVLDVDLGGAAGGVFASALGAQKGESVALRIAGSGPIEDWRGELFARFGERARYDAGIVTSGSTLSIEGDAEIAALVGQPVAQIVQPAVSLSLVANLALKRSVPLTIAAGFSAGRLFAEGTVDFEQAERLDVEYRLGIDDSAALAPVIGDVRFASAQVDGRVSGFFSSPVIEAQADMEGLSVPGAVTVEQIRLQAKSVIEPSRVTAEGRGSASALRPEDGDASFDPDYAFALAFVEPEDRIRIDRLQLRAAGAALEAEGGLAADAGDFTLTGTLRADDLKALPAPIPASGALDIAFEASRTAFDAPIAATLKANARNLRSDDPALADLTGAEPALVLEVGLPKAGPVRVDSLRLDLAAATLESDGTVDLSGSALDLAYRLAIKDLAAIAGAQTVSASGAVTLAGALRGPFDALQATGRSRLDYVDLQGFDLVDFALDLEASDLTGTPAATVSLTGESRYGPLDLKTEAAVQPDGAVAVPMLTMTLGSAEINGALTVGADGILRGSLDGATGDLSELPQSRRFGLRGDLEIGLTLSEADQHQRIALTASATKLLVPVGDNQLLELESLEADARATLTEPRPQLQLDVVATDVRMGFTRLTEIQATAEGTRERMTLSAKAAGDFRGAMYIDTTVIWSGSQERQRLSIDLDGTLFGQSFASPEPLEIAFGGGAQRVAPFSWRIGNGALAGEARRSETSAAVKLDAETLPLELVSVALPEFLPTGTFSADFDLSQTEGAAATGSLSLQLDDIQPAVLGFTRTPPHDVTSEGRLAAERLAITGSARAKDALRANFSFGLPLKLDLIAGAATLDDRAPIAGHLRWQGALAPLFMVADLPQHEASGTLKADVNFAGTLAVPRVAGALSLDEGRYEQLWSGFVAKDIDLDARVEDRRVTIETLSANDGNGGRISGSGFAEFPAEGPLLADIALDLRDVRVLRRVDAKATTSAQLNFRSEPDSQIVSGEIRPEQADFNIAQDFGSDIVTIDVVEIRGPDGEEAAATPEALEDERAIGLGLRVRGPRRLFVRGQGLDSEWGAELDIGGTVETPQLSGTLTLIKGNYVFANTDFDLTEGQILFTGGDEIAPILDLTAETEVENTQIELTVTGPLDSPDIALSSSPPLPEDEIMALLLFGSSIDDLTEVEIAFLAAQLASLSGATGGGGGGFDPIGGARSTLGLARFSVKGSEEEGQVMPRVSGGMYLTDDVYFEVGTETGSGVTVGTVEWELTRNLSLESSVSSSQENSISVRWSWDY